MHLAAEKEQVVCKGAAYCELAPQGNAGEARCPSGLLSITSFLTKAGRQPVPPSLQHQCRTQVPPAGGAGPHCAAAPATHMVGPGHQSVEVDPHPQHIPHKCHLHGGRPKPAEHQC